MAGASDRAGGAFRMARPMDGRDRRMDPRFAVGIHSAEPAGLLRAGAQGFGAVVVLAPAVQSFANLEEATPKPMVLDVKHTDEELTLAVKDAILADKDLAKFADKIDVKSEKGVVTLSGKLDSEKAKADLDLKVKSLPGVLDVVDNIEVVPVL